MVELFKESTWINEQKTQKKMDTLGYLMISRKIPQLKKKQHVGGN